jgi:hypothetical protein
MADQDQADLFGDADWRDLLNAAIARTGSKAAVAAELGVSRPTVSRITSTGASCMEASEDFIRRVMQRYHRWDCPATLHQADRANCNRANAEPPTHNPLAMRIWSVCQTCRHKPQGAKP